MRRLISYNVFEGDPNLIAEGQILVIRDSNNSRLIKDIQRRVNGSMTSILTAKLVYSIIPVPADATVVLNGVVTNSIQVDYGGSVRWSVSKTGYTPRQGEAANIVRSETNTIELSPIS